MPHVTNVVTDPQPREHWVQFYQTDGFLTAGVTDFLVEALRAGDPAVVIATSSHREAFVGHMSTRGVNVDGVIAANQLVMLDAEQLLETFMADGRPRPELFERSVGGVVAALAKSSRSVRAYGEMVDLLWRRGERAAALQLEELWNDLRRRHNFKLLCAYLIDSFYRQHGIPDICAVHSHVLAPEPPPCAQPEVLPGVVHALIAEITRRTDVEASLRASLRDVRDAEEHARRCKDELENFLDNAAVAIHRVDRDGILRYVNRAEQALLGYSAHELVGHHVSEFHADPVTIADLLQRMARGEIVRDHDARLVAKDGTIRQVQITSNAQTTEGELVTTRCFTRDVTAAKQAAEDRDAIYATSQLLNAELELEPLLQVLTERATTLCHAELGAFFYTVTDAAGQPHTLYTLTGASRAAFAQFSPPRLPPLLEHTLRELGAVRCDDITRDPRFVRMARHHAMPSGQLPVTSCLATPIIAASGEVLGGLFLGHSREAVFTDRDDRLVAAIAAQAATAIANARAYEQERRARVAAELAQRRTALLHGITIALSRALTAEQAAKIAIHESRNLVGASAGGVLLLDASGTGIERLIIDGDIHTDVVAQIKAMPLSADLPMFEAARTGHLVWVVGHEEIGRRYPTMVAIRDATNVKTWGGVPIVFEGRTLGAIGFRCRHERPLVDDDEAILMAIGRSCGLAMERARLHDAAQLARGEAERASRAKDEFLAMLGHELRNPLSPILTAVQLMRLRGEDTTVREQNIIERQVNHLIHLVDDLLDISRITQGKVELDKRPLKLAASITRAIEIAAPFFEERAHELTVETADDVWLEADETRLCQVITNLLTNAAKYTARGGKIAVRTERAAHEVVIRVKDNGFGIAPDFLPRVFDIFVQGERPPDRSRSGLGIGLALVRNLVAMHGGTVAASSEGIGRGSEFVVRLPTIAPRGPADGASDGERAVRDRAALVVRRIMVVDDNQDAAELLGDMLRNVGHEVVILNDGHHAIDIVNHFQPDIAVLDIGLADMDGYELAGRLRERLGASLRLIAVTGYGQAQDRARAERAGFEQHFTKPVGLGKLLAAIEAEERELSHVATVITP